MVTVVLNPTHNETARQQPVVIWMDMHYNGLKILIGGKKSGLNYIDFKDHFIKNLIYPNAWLSIFYFIARKVKPSIAK